MNRTEKQIFQVVCVVHALETTLESWKRLVDFRWESIKDVSNQISQACCLYHGKEVPCPVKAVRFDLGGIDMVLIEPLNKQGGDPYSDSLLAHGQGFHHLGIYAEEQAELLKQYAAAGLRPACEMILEEGHYQLFDFTEEMGFSMTLWDRMVGPCGPRNARGFTI